MSDILKTSGLTDQEQATMDGLVFAWNTFSNLPKQHPDELDEFRHAIHRCQDLLAVRIARREYPQGWPAWPAYSHVGTVNINGSHATSDIDKHNHKQLAENIATLLTKNVRRMPQKVDLPQGVGIKPMSITAAFDITTLDDKKPLNCD